MRRTPLILLTVLMLMASAQTILGNESGVEFQPCVSKASPELLPATLVIDLRDIANGKAKGYFLDDTDRAALATLLARCPTADDNVVSDFVKAVAARPSVLRIRSEGADVDVYVFHFGPSPSLKLKEESRHTALYDDFGQLAKVLNAMRTSGASATKVSIVYARLHSALPRATLTLTVQPAASQTKKDPVTVATITTGSTERFRLSANLPVNSTHVLTYDLQAKQPSLRQTPKGFLLGADVYLDDVLTDWRGRDLWRRLGAKALCNASTTAPLDSVGIVGAFRWNSFSVFGGPVWTKVTKTPSSTAAGGTVVVNDGYKKSIRVGLGFDLGTALTWFSKKK